MIYYKATFLTPPCLYRRWPKAVDFPEEAPPSIIKFIFTAPSIFLSGGDIFLFIWGDYGDLPLVGFEIIGDIDFLLAIGDSATIFFGDFGELALWGGGGGGHLFNGFIRGEFCLNWGLRLGWVYFWKEALYSWSFFL